MESEIFHCVDVWVLIGEYLFDPQGTAGIAKVEKPPSQYKAGREARSARKRARHRKSYHAGGGDNDKENVSDAEEYSVFQQDNPQHHVEGSLLVEPKVKPLEASGQGVVPFVEAPAWSSPPPPPASRFADFVSLSMVSRQCRYLALHDDVWERLFLRDFSAEEKHVFFSWLLDRATFDSGDVRTTATPDVALVDLLDTVQQAQGGASLVRSKSHGGRGAAPVSPVPEDKILRARQQVRHQLREKVEAKERSWRELSVELGSDRLRQLLFSAEHCAADWHGGDEVHHTTLDECRRRSLGLEAGWYDMYLLLTIGVRREDEFCNQLGRVGKRFGTRKQGKTSPSVPPSIQERQVSPDSSWYCGSLLCYPWNSFDGQGIDMRNLEILFDRQVKLLHEISKHVSLLLKESDQATVGKTSKETNTTNKEDDGKRFPLWPKRSYRQLEILLHSYQAAQPFFSIEYHLHRTGSYCLSALVLGMLYFWVHMVFVVCTVVIAFSYWAWLILWARDQLVSWPGPGGYYRVWGFTLPSGVDSYWSHTLQRGGRCVGLSAIRGHVEVSESWLRGLIPYSLTNGAVLERHHQCLLEGSLGDLGPHSLLLLALACYALLWVIRLAFAPSRFKKKKSGGDVVQAKVAVAEKLFRKHLGWEYVLASVVIDGVLSGAHGWLGAVGAMACLSHVRMQAWFFYGMDALLDDLLQWLNFPQFTAEILIGVLCRLVNTWVPHSISDALTERSIGLRPRAQRVNTRSARNGAYEFNWNLPNTGDLLLLQQRPSGQGAVRHDALALEQASLILRDFQPVPQWPSSQFIARNLPVDSAGFPYLNTWLPPFMGSLRNCPPLTFCSPWLVTHAVCVVLQELAFSIAAFTLFPYSWRWLFVFRFFLGTTDACLLRICRMIV